MTQLAGEAPQAQGDARVIIEPFRGYGSRQRTFLMGHVFRQSTPDGTGDRGSFLARLREIGHRIARRKVVGAAVTARVGVTTAKVETDRDGYFRFDLRLAEPLPADRSWHDVELTLDADPSVRAIGMVHVPRNTARFVVVSDIDDTVMYTGVGDWLVMLWRLFVEGAESRVAFPGVPTLYRALHDGIGGGEDNPILYVSRAPWGTYDMLTAFFRMHGMPAGPELILREWGMSWRHPFPRLAKDHKRRLVDGMLDFYADLPFVLIGDSGQHDPEIYAEAVRRHPGRVRAVYIRNVSSQPDRAVEIRALADAVMATGCKLVLAADTVSMAESAVALGLVAPGTAGNVEGERAADGDRERAEAIRFDGPGRGVPVASADVTSSGDGTTPPNVIVEPDDDRSSSVALPGIHP